MLYSQLWLDLARSINLCIANKTGIIIYLSEMLQRRINYVYQEIEGNENEIEEITMIKTWIEYTSANRWRFLTKSIFLKKDTA